MSPTKICLTSNLQKFSIHSIPARIQSYLCNRESLKHGQKPIAYQKKKMGLARQPPQLTRTVEDLLQSALILSFEWTTHRKVI